MTSDAFSAGKRKALASAQPFVVTAGELVP